MRAKSNNCKIVTIAQVFIFMWRFIYRSRSGCLNSLLLKPGFHIVVSVVSVVRKKFIGQIQLYGNLPYKCSLQKKPQIQLVVRDRMNSICPMDFFRTIDTTDTTIWKPGLKLPTFDLAEYTFGSQRFQTELRCVVEQKTSKWGCSRHRDRTRASQYQFQKSLPRQFTFMVRMSVLSAISNMMKYSKGLESTILQMRYCQVFGSSGINRSDGFATIAKWRQSLWWGKKIRRITRVLSMEAIRSLSSNDSNGNKNFTWK